MTGNALFISYGHGDVKSVNWLERLKLYLAPLRKSEVVDIWDDTRIKAGDEWRREIEKALEQSVAAILLVGPAFLASEFITREELPILLAASKQKGIKIYPLVVGYCSYKQSVLEPYQAFNDPDKPLEALAEAEQNRILNEISLTVDKDLRQIHATPAQQSDTLKAMRAIDKNLDLTWTAFKAQVRRRNQLFDTMVARLKIKTPMQYENFFFRYFKALTEEEKFQFDQIRAITEGPLYKGNQEILSALEGQPQVFTEIPNLTLLQQHLVFWLNKYEKVFTQRPEMCLLYTGVEDGVPFPKNIGDEVKAWIKAHRG